MKLSTVFKPLFRDQTFVFFSPLKPADIEFLLLEKLPNPGWLSRPKRAYPDYRAEAGQDYFFLTREYTGGGGRSIPRNPTAEAVMVWVEGMGTEISVRLRMPVMMRVFVGVMTFSVLVTLVKSVFERSSNGLNLFFVPVLVVAFVSGYLCYEFNRDCNKLKEFMLEIFNGRPLS